MSSLLLHKTGSLGLSSEGRVIKREQFSLVGDAIKVMESIERVRVQIDEQSRQARDDGFQKGFEQGRGEGYSAGWAQAMQMLSTKLAELDTLIAHRLAERDAQLTDLALAVVARVARDIGSPKMMAALVGKALDELKGDAAIRVRVAQVNYDAIHAQLGHGMRELSLVVDDQLGPFDCEFDAQGGHLDVGLASQLEVIREALHGRRAELSIAA